MMSCCPTLPSVCHDSETDLKLYLNEHQNQSICSGLKSEAAILCSLNGGGFTPVSAFV